MVAQVVTCGYLIKRSISKISLSNFTLRAISQQTCHHLEGLSMDLTCQHQTCQWLVTIPAEYWQVTRQSSVKRGILLTNCWNEQSSLECISWYLLLSLYDKHYLKVKTVLTVVFLLEKPVNRMLGFLKNLWDTSRWLKRIFPWAHYTD